MNKRQLVFVILLLGFMLRFFRLGDIPVGFHRDEAFLGYNAYSILKTAKDINGNFLPLHFESFIYSPAGYSYFAIPSILIFDLNPFSVRFPSALFGSLTVILTFFLLRQFFKEDKFYDLALWSSLFIAISPWHINLSRTSTENTIVVFFITLGILFFLKWTELKRNLFLLLSFLSFGLTLFIYQAPRAFLPFFIPLILLCFVPRDFKKRMPVLFLYVLVVLIPLFLILGSPNLSSRVRTLNIFSHPETQLTIDENIREDGVSNISNFISRTFHNKALGYSSLFLQNYFQHFSYNFLFTDNSLPLRYKVPQMGLLYIFELPLLFLGTFYLLKIKKRVGIFLIGWVLLAPIGSSLTFDDVPNLQRSLIIFPALSIISAAGFYFLVQSMSKLKYYRLVLAITIFFFVYNAFFYIHQYYVHGLKHRPWYRQEGYKELVSKVNSLLPNYKKAIVTNRETGPTIFFLFFGKYSPSLFQKETNGKFGIESDSVDFSKYNFTNQECPLRSLKSGEKTEEKLYNSLNTGDKQILYVNHGNCKLPQIPVNELSTIKRNDGSVVFRLFEVK